MEENLFEYDEDEFDTVEDRYKNLLKGKTLFL